MTLAEIRKRYLLHTLLHKFTEQLFFAFGALLIFTKTESILGAIMFAVIGNTTTTLAKSLGFGSTINLFRRIGLTRTMSIGLMMKVLALCGIFYLEPGTSWFYAALFSLQIFESAGNTLYVVGANTIMFGVIGSSRAPGLSSAQISALHTLSGLLAAGAGILLSGFDSFLYSFLLGGVVLLGSVFPLSGLPTPKIPAISFFRNLKRISASMFLANVNP